MTVLVLGDQLVHGAGPLAERPNDRVLVIEATGFARRLPYHPHKLTLVFSAMRHRRDELRADGRAVDYRRVATFADGLADHLAAHPEDELVAMRPASHRAGERLRTLVEARGGTLDLVENETFLCPPAAFDERFPDDLPRQETFYRWMRRETGYLLDDGEPVGGAWNFDERNREPVPADYEPAPPPRFEPDDLTAETAAWVAEEFTGGYASPPYGGDWADPGPFRWPVTRSQARHALEHFATEHLAGFGPYQDAMADDEWAMDHSLLSAPLNLGLLRPAAVVERVVAAGEADPTVPIESVEGFVRQVLGWREFMRHAYRRLMPGLAGANLLGAERPLPPAYWTGETAMRCLGRAVESVRRRGYSHHGQRLMVLSNFAMLYGADPAAVDRWFHAGYVDAFDWVTTPNVVGMGVFGTDALSTKPYAASANYIDRMSDHCDGCAFDPDATVGAGACPFNALYWDFLARHEDDLRSRGRMGLVYGHLDRKDDDELVAIRERAADLRRRAAEGDL